MESKREKAGGHSEDDDIAVGLRVDSDDGKMDESRIEKLLYRPPKILKKTAGSRSCCIFRIPGSVVGANRSAYYPQIVSIGPLHHGGRNLEMIQEHKGRFLADFLDRTMGRFSVGELCEMVGAMEGPIRESYAESLTLTRQYLTEMMVLDGVFIVELLLKTRGLSGIHPDDPIFKMTWIFPLITRDLVRVENQIPYFLLSLIYDMFTRWCGENKAPPPPPLHQLVLELFDYAFQRPKEAIEKQWEMKEWKHLLDIFRMSILPRKRRSRKKKTKKKVTGGPSQLIPSVKKLRREGIEVRAGRGGGSFLDVRFKGGVLEIPVVTIDDFMTCVLLNCIAFEQCYSNSTTHITDYTAFMGCLIGSAGDAELLSEIKIVENYLGTNGDIANFFHKVNKEVVVDLEGSFLGDLYRDVNEYCSRSRRGVSRRSVRWWKVFNASSYFTHPWSIISVIAASLLLLLTAIQTFFTVYSYWVPPPVS